ncbi:hypothetical protein [Burkholderia sp. BCC1972]|uniref:hypothetical protein n=1 Tax=Burkholderia sp. BCC1972 TaxID=2817438 RepID=UPI002ABD8C10|nr:hypothetical protein [Burkholderia sp. BCC1972]
MVTTVSKVSKSARLSPRTLAIVVGVGLAFVVLSLVLTALQPHHVVGIDPTFGLPSLPRGVPFQRTNHLIATVAMGVFGLVGVAYGLCDLVRARTVLPLMIAISGVFVDFPEVFVDIMGAAYYPWAPDVVAYKIFGREMPFFIVAGWFGYGAFTYLIFRIIASNPTTRSLWLTWFGAALSGVIFEEILLAMGVWHYYGNQPLVLIRLHPWWWTPCNSVGVFLAAAFAWRFRDTLQGWKALAMAFITPMSVAGIYAFIAMPAWIVANANYGWLVTQLGGLLTFGLGFVAFYLVLRLVLRRDPFEFADRNAVE